MRLKRPSVALSSFVVFGAAMGSAAAVSSPPEYGLRGLRRVEIVFVNVGRGGIVGGVVPADGVVPPVPPTEDLANHALAENEECQQVAPTLGRAGLEVVEQCRRDDVACAKLYLTAETAAIPGVADRALLVGIELSQRAQLTRDKTVDLSIPTTWSEHQVGAVTAQHSATITACISLRNLATLFASMWTVANK